MLGPEVVDRALPVGSPAQLSVLFAPPALRPSLEALYGLRAELRRAAQEPRDAQLARLKLQWWREEIGRLAAGDAQHPATRALLGRIDTAAAARYLQELVHGAQAERFAPPSRDLDELGLYCYQSSGALQVLAAGAAGDDIGTPEQPAVRFGHHLGSAVRLVELIRDAARDAAAGRCRLPAMLLERHQVEPSQLAAPSTPAAARSLLAALADTARTELTAAHHQLQSGMQSRQRAGLVLAALHLALLERLQSCDYDVGGRCIELGGLRSLWIAWRTARRSLGSAARKGP